MSTNEELNEVEKPEELLFKILNKQYQHSIIKAAKSVKRSRAIVNAETTRLENHIKSEAKRYGQGKELVEDGIKQYKEEIESIKEFQDKVKAVLMKQKEEIQLIEFEKTAQLIVKRENRKEIKKSEDYKNYKTELNTLNKELLKEMEQEKPNETEIRRKTEEYDAMAAKDILVICESEIQELKRDISELRKMAIEIDKQIEQATNNIKDYIEQATKSEESMLNTVPKQNAIQKLINTILDKIGGNKKFIENVVNKLNNQVEKMKMEIMPDLINKMQEDGINIIAGNLQKVFKEQNINQQDIDIKSIAVGKLNEPQESYKEIIDSGNDAKQKSVKSLLGANVSE